MSAHKPRHKFQEIPLRPGSLKHRFGVNVHLVKNHGQLIHKRNIDISLTVFDNLRRLGHLDRFRPVYACIHHQFIYFGNRVKRLLIHTRYNLRDGFQPMHLVARVDTLRRITNLKVNAAF